MLIEGQFSVPAAPESLLQHLFDVRLMASCLPGCETIEPIDDKKYRAVISMAMAGIKARFDLEVEITEQDQNNVWATTRGEEGGRASTLQADSRITLTGSPTGTVVSYRSDVSITGRLGRFALGMMKKKAQNLGDEFAANLQKKLEDIGAEVAATAAAAAAAPRAAPPVAVAAPEPALPSPPAAASLQPVWWHRLWAWLTGRRSTARTASH
jgi:carbon monoxide dehydrogenase subunit G